MISTPSLGRAGMAVASKVSGCPGCLEGCALEQFEVYGEQPVSTEATIDGAFVKTFVLPLAGSMVPQHAHGTAHLTAIVRGSIRVWVNGVLDRDYAAPEGVVIPAQVFHNFQTLEADTLLMCIHKADPVVVAENALPVAA